MKRMHAEHEAVDLERDLLGIDVVAEVALADRDAYGLGELVEPVFEGAHERVARRTRPIIELGARTDEETPTWALSPLHPAIEQRAQARFAARMPQCRHHYFLHELARRLFDDRDL